MALVLVIEDNPDVRDLMKKAVESKGHDTCVAGDGVEGLAQARQRQPDLILLDLMMPVMNGWKFRSEQMSDPHIADIPVVVVSAHMDIQEIDAAECISKPCTVGQLLDAVERHRLHRDGHTHH